VARPPLKDEAGPGPHLLTIRQRIESIFWTRKDLLTLERHGHGPWRACVSACSAASHASLPASASTTGWVVRAAPLWTTAPELRAWSQSSKGELGRRVQESIDSQVGPTGDVVPQAGRLGAQ
jgi:hypothetical protein